MLNFLNAHWSLKFKDYLVGGENIKYHGTFVFVVKEKEKTLKTIFFSLDGDSSVSVPHENGIDCKYIFLTLANPPSPIISPTVKISLLSCNDVPGLMNGRGPGFSKYPGYSLGCGLTPSSSLR